MVLGVPSPMGAITCLQVSSWPRPTPVTHLCSAPSFQFNQASLFLFSVCGLGPRVQPSPSQPVWLGSISMRLIQPQSLAWGRSSE